MTTTMKEVVASRIAEFSKEANDDIGSAVSDYLQIGADFARSLVNPKEASAEDKEANVPAGASALRAGFGKALKRVAVPAAVGTAAGGAGYAAGKDKGREDEQLAQRKQQLLEQLFSGYMYAEEPYANQA